MGLLALALLLSGCIQIGGDKVREVRRHALDVASVSTDTPIDASVRVSLFDARARYDLRVVAADESGTVSFLEFERWAEDPRDGLTDLVRETLAESGAFRSVQRADSGLEADMDLRGFVSACDLIRSGAGSRARLRLRLTLSDGNTDQVRHSASYQAERPLPGDDATGLGAAMTECVGDVLTRALADWAATDRP
jgi:ABC-type uncharacterized transport system auxiliary subunit